MSKNTGKRPHELALELFAKTPTVTPTELEKFVGNGPYAAKHVWFLKKLGHDISVVKDGRSVVSYTYVGPGTSVTVPEPVVVKVAKPKTVKEKKSPVVKKTKAVKVSDDAEDTPVMDYAVNMAGPVGNIEPEIDFEDVSYFATSVDPDWDSYNTTDLKYFL